MRPFPIGTIVSFKSSLPIMKEIPRFLFSCYVVTGYSPDGKCLLAYVYDLEYTGQVNEKSFFSHTVHSASFIWKKFLHEFPHGITHPDDYNFRALRNIDWGKDDIQNLRPFRHILSNEGQTKFERLDWDNFKNDIYPRIQNFEKMFLNHQLPLINIPLDLSL